MSRGIKLPELSHPKTPRPEIPVLLLPLPGHIARFCEEPRPGIWTYRLRRRLKNRLPLHGGAVDSLAQNSNRLLHRFCFVGYQSVGGRLLAGCRIREDLHACWLRHAFRLFLHSVQEFLPASDRIRRKNHGLILPILFLIPVADAAI